MGSGMGKTCKVVLYGSSLFMAGAETSLKGRPGLEVVRVESTTPEILEVLHDLQPDVIIVDLATLDLLETLPILADYPGLPVIGLDLSGNSATILWGRKRSVSTAAGLTELIQNAVMGMDSEVVEP